LDTAFANGFRVDAATQKEGDGAFSQSSRLATPRLFSGCGPTTTRPRPGGRLSRQVDLAAVRKLQIAQMDAQTPVTAVAALDHIAGAHGEPVGKTIRYGRHGELTVEPQTGPLMPCGR
jgi:hypothetical protein